MKHTITQTVYYADTDSYGVVWHGTYLRWMEQARVEFCRHIGLDLVEMQKNDVVLPVANLNIKYKASAKLEDKLFVETWISKYNPLAITFSQVIKSQEADKVYITSEVTVVAVNSEGKLYRRLPDILKKACEAYAEAG